MILDSFNLSREDCVVTPVIDPEPVPGSSQILLDLNGDQITLARGEVAQLTTAVG